MPELGEVPHTAIHVVLSLVAITAGIGAARELFGAGPGWTVNLLTLTLVAQVFKRVPFLHAMAPVAMAPLAWRPS